MSSEVELSTSPSQKNFQERKAIQEISGIPYKFKPMSTEDNGIGWPQPPKVKPKPPKPPPPPRPALKPSKSLGPQVGFRPISSPKEKLSPMRTYSPQPSPKTSSPLPTSTTPTTMEDSFDNIDLLNEFKSVPATRPRAMGKSEQLAMNTGVTPDDSTLSKAWKRFSDKPFGSFRGNKTVKRESNSNISSPATREKTGQFFIANDLDSNTQDKDTEIFLENAIVVPEENPATSEALKEMLSPEKKIHSSTELPSKIDRLSTILEARVQVAHEIYTTEYTYVNLLELLVEIFKKPMEAQLDELEIQQIFCNVEKILNFNREVLALLYERLVEWDDSSSCIGDVFKAKFNQFASSLYTVYCSSYDNAESYIANKMKRKKEFEILMQQCMSDSRVSKGMNITYYLITPVQRIPRYLMLLKDLLKSTDSSHIDYDNIKESHEKISKIADYVNSQIREVQSQKAMQFLKTEIQGLADLEKDGRVIIKEGPVFLMRIRKEYQCILFNDYLVLAYKSDNGSVIELKLPLEVVWIEDLQDLDPQTHSEDAIEIYTPDRPYTIYTKTNTEKKLWLNKLFETIKIHIATRSGMKEIPKNLNDIDILNRKATFVYANGDVYDGMFSDAKRHGHGEMVWSDKTRYVGEWGEDERSGEGEMRYNTGEAFKGMWENDKQHGEGRMDYCNGDVMKGNWKCGYRDGKAVIQFGNGDKFEGHFSRDQVEGEGRYVSTTGMHFIGQYKKSQRCGRGTLCTINGDYFDGEFKRNIFNGDGTMLYKDQSKYIGQWKNGVRCGAGEFTTPEGDIFKGRWSEDRKDGHGTMKYANGGFYEGMWCMDKRHGFGRMEFSNGDYYEGAFKHDFRFGRGLMKYHNGAKYDGNFEYNMRSGEGIMIYEDGKTYVGEWKLDMREGKGQLVSLHSLKYDGDWVNDKPHGTGNIKSSKLIFEYRGSWVNGKRDGTGTETGTKGKYNGSWKDGMRNGRGLETSLVGTTFEGHWTYEKKTGSVERKLPSGLKETQKWREGLILNTKNCLIPPELPLFPVFDF